MSEPSSTVPAHLKRPRCAVAFELDPELRRAVKIFAAERGMTITSVFERGARLMLADAGSPTPADTARAEVMAMIAELGLERAITVLRSAARTAA